MKLMNFLKNLLRNFPVKKISFYSFFFFDRKMLCRYSFSDFLFVRINWAWHSENSKSLRIVLRHLQLQKFIARNKVDSLYRKMRMLVNIINEKAGIKQMNNIQIHLNKQRYFALTFFDVLRLSPLRAELPYSKRKNKSKLKIQSIYRIKDVLYFFIKCSTSINMACLLENNNVNLFYVFSGCFTTDVSLSRYLKQVTLLINAIKYALQ